MEQTNLPVVAKKIWNRVRVMYILLRKGISKEKLTADLNAVMTRGKIARKALHNLMFHHAHNSIPRHVSFHGPRDYEFSCSNKRRNPHHAHFFPCANAPATHDDVAAVRKALEMLNDDVAASTPFWQSPAVRDLVPSEMSSPALPGFGRSPGPVRQLRITDSPFPVGDVDEGCHVDRAAEEFISRFYNELRRQNEMASR